MEQKKIVSVLTPVYNRKELIGRLYKSLLGQTNQNFIWVIIDDGSKESLEQEIEKWKMMAQFPIIYHYKENGGKHTALNMGFQLVDTELTFTVDSDDIFIPEAIESIESQWNTIEDKSDIAGISFLRGHSNSEVIGTKFPEEGIYNDIDMRCRKHVKGDKAEVWRTDILRQFSFPVFQGEKFQGENYIWWQISFKYNLLYVNKIIYITEYLDGGLTKSGRKLRISCPLGGMENSKMGFNRKFPLRERIKRGILYNCYAFFAGYSMKKRLEKSNNFKALVEITYLPGWMLYLKWKKYLE